MQITAIPEQNYVQATITFAAMRQEVLSYRAEIQRLQEEMRKIMTEQSGRMAKAHGALQDKIAEMGDENDKLREEIARLEAGAG